MSVLLLFILSKENYTFMTNWVLLLLLFQMPIISIGYDYII